MKEFILLMTICLLAACAGSETPPSIAYVPATQVESPSQATAEAARPVRITTENPVPEPKAPKRHKSHIAATAAANKASSMTALDADFEGSILTYLYQHGRSYRVVVDGPSGDWDGEWGEDADVTTVRLGQDDGSEPDIAIGGDPNWFKVDKIGAGIDETSMRARRDKLRAMTAGTHSTEITVKYFKRGARTTLHIGTGSRKYRFNLQCSHVHGGTYNHEVQFTYAYDTQVSTYQPPRRVPQAQPAPVVADTRYSIDGSQEWRPREWAAWNDGANTHIRPSPSVQSRPAPLLGAGGTFHIDPANNQYVVAGLPNEIVFPWGENALVIKRLP